MTHKVDGITDPLIRVYDYQIDENDPRVQGQYSSAPVGLSMDEAIRQVAGKEDRQRLVNAVLAPDEQHKSVTRCPRLS